MLQPEMPPHADGAVFQLKVPPPSEGSQFVVGPGERVKGDGALVFKFPDEPVSDLRAYWKLGSKLVLNTPGHPGVC